MLHHSVRELRRRAGELLGLKRSQCGAVTFVQRLSSALGLNVLMIANAGRNFASEQALSTPKVRPGIIATED